LLLPLFVVACCSIAAQTKPPVGREFGADVFAVPGLPLGVQDAVLIKTDKGLLLRCQLSNNSEEEMTGMRYELVVEQSDEDPRYIFNRSEGFKLKAYETRIVTFQTPLRLTLKREQRIVLMPNQAVRAFDLGSSKSQGCTSRLLIGDYSVVPTVIRVANQIDAPITPRVIY
jgi:hypothetical protein